MESLPPDVVYAVLRLAQPTGQPIARLACVSTGFARMAKEHLWRWHCRDQLALDASPSDAQRSDSEATTSSSRANPDRANAVKDALAAITASLEDPISMRERLERMLHDMGSEEVFNLAKLVNVCPGVRPALLRGREFKAMNCGCGSSLQCACWKPVPSEVHPSSAPHVHPSKFEIMDVVRSGVPEMHFVMFACFVHQHEEYDAVPFFLIRGHVIDFQSSKMYESQTPFVCDEQCPYCSSQVWDMMQLLNFPRVSKILICYAGNKIYVTFPEVVTYVCTKGHLYGLRRLGAALRGSDSGMAEVEVERVEGHEGSQSSQGSGDNEEAEQEALDEAFYAVLGSFMQRAVRGELEEEESDDDVSNEEEETDDDVSNEEEESDDDVSNEEEESDDDVSNEEEESDDDVEPGTSTSGAQAAALTVPAASAAAAAGPAATPELAHAHVVEAATSDAAAAPHAPNAAPVDVTVPSPSSGAAFAAASDSASLLPTAAAIPHGQLLEAAQPAKDGSADGHLYGLRRLGAALRGSDSGMAEVEVERVEGHEGSQSSQGSGDNEEAEQEALDEAFYAVLGSFMQRAVRGELEEEESDDDVSNEEEETDDDVSNEEEESDDDVSNEEEESDDDVSNEEEESDDDVEPGTSTSGAQAAALTVPAASAAAAAGPAATPELAHAHVVEAATSDAAAAPHAPNAAPVDVTVPSPSSGAAFAAASDSASLLPTA
ncbi:unnamed protein product [Closterium sp. Yama58-4]|nr:unnamed protein product [Closterium sp. Yama58-4]